MSNPILNRVLGAVLVLVLAMGQARAVQPVRVPSLSASWSDAMRAAGRFKSTRTPRRANHVETSEEGIFAGQKAEPGPAGAALDDPGLTSEEQAALQRVKAVLEEGGAVPPEHRRFLDEWFPRFVAKGLVGRSPARGERMEITEWFPKLARKGDWRVTGQACYSYNCISWSVGETEQWLNPPPTLDASDRFYQKYGYAPLQPGESPDQADIALWTDGEGSPTHACRRVAGEWWESKLGSAERILHRLHELEGKIYGKPARYYRKAA